MKYAYLIACALPLAACDSGPSVDAENASVQEVAKQMAEAGKDGSFVRPGRWEQNVTFEAMDLPDMPPEVKAQMEGFTGKVQKQYACLTPEEVKQPKEDFFAGTDKSCRYDRFTMVGGKIDEVLRCEQAGAQPTMTMTGTYDPNNYQMQMTMSGGGQGPAAMSMRMRVEAKRVGECKGDEAS